VRRAALLAVLLAAGCSASARSANEDLVTDVREFQEGLRWRSYDRAAGHVPAHRREQFLDAHEELDRDLRIVDYELERVTIERDGRHAVVRVRFTWHLESVGRVHETTVDERWERQGKVWRIVGAAHRRGEPLPEPALPVESTPSALP
jgi:hypothetical protein